jgi:predicted ATP-dependent Lon-type protease
MGWAVSRVSCGKIAGRVRSKDALRSQETTNIELKQFVTETLVQISEGIEEAQRQLKERGSEARINTNMTTADAGHLVTGGRRRPVEYVEFDVAILANEGTETKAGIGLTVASLLKLDAEGKSSQTAGRESRIKFRVPMSYPMHKYDSVGAEGT